VVFQCFLHVRVSQRFQVHLREFQDDLEHHKVDDAVFYLILIGEQVDVNPLAVEANQCLEKSEHERYSCTIIIKLMLLVVRELHDSDALVDFRREEHVQRNGAWELDKEDNEVVLECELVQMIISDNLQDHASKHQYLAKHDNQNITKILSLLVIVY
jgi:hypothetical protein